MNPNHILLTPEQLAQKRAYTDGVHERIHSPNLEKPGLRTLLSMQVEVTRDLESHIDAQQEQVRQVLLGLLIPAGTGVPDSRTQALSTVRAELNAAIHAAAATLGIDLIPSK